MIVQGTVWKQGAFNGYWKNILSFALATKTKRQILWVPDSYLLDSQPPLISHWWLGDWLERVRNGTHGTEDSQGHKASLVLGSSPFSLLFCTCLKTYNVLVKKIALQGGVQVPLYLSSPHCLQTKTRAKCQHVPHVIKPNLDGGDLHTKVNARVCSLYWQRS